MIKLVDKYVDPKEIISVQDLHSHDKIMMIEMQMQSLSGCIQDCEEHLRKYKKANADAYDAKSSLVVALKDYNARLADYTRLHPLWNMWLRYIPGIDEVLAGHLIGRIMWINNPMQILSYMGLICQTECSNVFLLRKLLNSFKYFAVKQNPYTLYYYEQYLKMSNEKEYSKDYKHTISKHKVLIMFILDMYFMYNLVVEKRTTNELLKPNFYEELSNNGVVISDFKVNRFDFCIITNGDGHDVSLYRINLNKYKIAINKYQKLFLQKNL